VVGLVFTQDREDVGQGQIYQNNVIKERSFERRYKKYSAFGEYPARDSRGAQAGREKEWWWW